jgi:ABC-type polysaccharide/polyol phosphate export permease
MTILLYIISGVYFTPWIYSTNIQYALSFNPVTQGIELLRFAYYEVADPVGLNAFYLYRAGGSLCWALASLRSGCCAAKSCKGEQINDVQL